MRSNDQLYDVSSENYMPKNSGADLGICSRNKHFITNIKTIQVILYDQTFKLRNHCSNIPSKRT